MNPNVLVRMDDPSRVGEARRAASTLASELGFDDTRIGTVATVVTEAATNLVKHARDGQILLRGERRSDGNVLTVMSLDAGPGIEDVDRSLHDGFSTAGSPGTGLGAIRRLSSSFDLYTNPSGTILLASVGSQLAFNGGALQVGAVWVPHPSESVCGDAWDVAPRAGGCRVFVGDGLGHGVSASEAAETAHRIFRERSGDSLTELLRRIHDGLRATRGAAAAIADLDADRRMVTFAGVGNISGVIVTDEGTRTMVSHHGVLGHEAGRFHEFQYPWPPHASVVLHSDGISTHWNLASHPGLLRRHPQFSAAMLFRDSRRGRDDATAVVVREAA